jgi:L-alanine-DL-glutamate epimerase-like enolase superfamily enzyme
MQASTPAAVRIAAIDATPLRFALDPPFTAAVRVIDSVDLVLVRVRDTDGRQGIGTAFAFGSDDARPILEIARALGATRVGAAAVGVEAHASAMRASLALAGAGGPAIAALGAIDLALWDLTARRAGLPLWRLLGGARERVASYGSGGSLGLSIDGLLEETRRFVEAGHRAVKIKAGHGAVEDARRLAALRDAFGSALRIAVDANQQFTPKAAIRWARALEPWDPWWIEEPVRADDVTGHAEVRAAVSADLASGETLYGTADAARMIAARAVDVLMPNLQRVGGLTAWRKLAASAELAGIAMAAHVHPEVQVHLMCAVPGAVALECWPGWPWLWQESIAIADGFATPPDAPGLGFTLDEDRVRAHRADRR